MSRNRPAGDKASFVRALTAAIKQVSPNLKIIKYLEEDFRLGVGDDGCEVWQFNLQELYEGYLDTPGIGARRLYLGRLTRSIAQSAQPIPSDYGTACRNLMPVVRERWRVAHDGVPSDDDHNRKTFPHGVIGQHFVVCLGCDSDLVTRYVDTPKLDEWGYAWNQTLKPAIERLRSLPYDVLPFPGRCLGYQLIGCGGRAASLLLAPDMIADLKVDGAPIVMPISAGSLLVTGDEDEVGLKTMLDSAPQALDWPRTLAGDILRLEGGEWAPWLPDESSPHFADCKKMSYTAASRRYDGQEDLLRRGGYADHDPADFFLAGLQPVTSPGIGVWASTAVWSEGVSCLLPRAELVMFASPKLVENLVMIFGVVPWEAAMRVVGGLVEPQGIYPERYLVRGFPTDEQLAAMQPVLPESAAVT